MMHKLRCANEERQKVIIIQTPNAMGSSGLEIVYTLRFSQKPNIAGENEKCEGRKGRFR